MGLLNTGIVFHDRPDGGWYCNDCKSYVHHDLVHSHKHTGGIDMTTERLDATLRPSESSKADTGEAIDRILEAIMENGVEVGADVVLERQFENDPAYFRRYKDRVVKNASSEVQELIRGEVVKELELLRDIATDPQNIRPNWVAKITLEKRIKALSSGQTDGTA